MFRASVCIGALILGGSAAPLLADPAQVDLLLRYPTTLVSADLKTCNRTWKFTEADVFHLTQFHFEIFDSLRIDIPPADVGIGGSVDGALWAVIIPRAGGVLHSTALAGDEAIANVWLRFHPMRIDDLFPPATVLSDGDADLVSEMETIATRNIHSSYQCSDNPLIPPPQSLTIVVRTVDAHDRYFTVDTISKTAHLLFQFDQRTDLQLLGQWPGFQQAEATGVAKSGSYLYVAARALQVLDISSPDRIQRVGFYPFQEHPIYGIAVSGNYAFAAGDGGLKVLDITDRTQPRLVTQLALDGYPQSVVIAGTFAYVASGFLQGRGGALRIIDISDPAHPKVAGRFEPTTGTYGAAVNGRYAYLAASTSGLIVVDISDPADPQKVGARGVIGDARGVALAGQYAYLACGTNGLQIMDVSDPTHPAKVGTYLPGVQAVGLNQFPQAAPRWSDQGPFCYAVTVSGTLAYVAAGPSGLHIVDVSNPTKPTRVGFVDTDGTTYRFEIDGVTAYVADGSVGVKVINATQPDRPEITGRFGTNGNASGLTVAGNLAYLADWYEGLQIIDISDVSHPTLVSQLSTGERTEKVTVVGDYAYVTSYGEGLKIVDVHDPAQPGIAASYKPSTSPIFDVAVAGQYAYIASGFHTLDVVDISDSTKPQRLHEWTVIGQPQAIKIVGNYLYVATLWDGLEVIDISDPAHLKRLGQVAPKDWWAKDITVAENFVYVVDVFHGVRAVDIHDPANPRQVGFSSDLNGFGIATFRNYAYVVGSGLWVMDVLDPSKPRIVGGDKRLGVGYAALVTKGQLYVAASHDGLFIYNPYQPQLRFERASHFHAGGFSFAFKGEPGRAFRVQRSNDLKHWENWKVVTATGSPEEALDESAASLPTMFYRAVPSEQE